MEDYGSIHAKDRSTIAHPYTSLFERPCLEQADYVLSLIMSPQTTFINIMLSSLKLTTKERDSRESEDPCYERYVILSLLLPAMVILTILYLPLFAIAFAIWAPIQRYRNPHRLRVYGQSGVDYDRSGVYGLTVVSIDTRLLIEYKARWKENLAHTRKRAKDIGQRLDLKRAGGDLQMVPHEHRITVDKESSQGEPAEIKQTESSDKQIGNLTCHQNSLFEIIEDFANDADIICFQGVFDTRAEEKLVRQICQSYPYVISDVKQNSWRTNRFWFGSGLLLASRLPVSEVKFHCFADSSGEDKDKSKGCLIVTIDVGSDDNDVTRQLRVTNTELQDGYGADAVTTRCHQLSQISGWMKELGNSIPQVICCNLHFDNASPDEKSNWSHPWFADVIDRCALHPGEDHPGAIGTELKPQKIYASAISSPESMKRTLGTPEGRMEFLTVVQRSDIGGASSHPSGCRTNRILYRHGTNTKVKLNRYSIITQLAGLTTYLPLAVELVLKESTERE